MPEAWTTKPDDIGQRVRHRRLDLGMTIEEVAERAGMAPTFVGYLEGQPAALGIDTLIRLAHALRTSVNALAGGSANAGAQVGFEVDEIAHPRQAGWSVLVSGRARVVTEPELCRLRQRLTVEPWVPGSHDVYVSIEPDRITGRRIRAAGSTGIGA
ncbi:MAG: pyridoxamine 5'-phosphate oxidase family protein [Nocardioidaceae bacterium]